MTMTPARSRAAAASSSRRRTDMDTATDHIATESPAPEKFEAWAFVELMGHNKIAGRVTEQAIAGRNLLRVDVPLEDGTFRTQFYGGSAIFAIHPASEEVVRKLVTRMKPEPVFAFMLDRTRQLEHLSDDVDDEQEF